MNAAMLALSFFYILLPIVGCVILYYIVKSAVKNGIREARSDK